MKRLPPLNPRPQERFWKQIILGRAETCWDWIGCVLESGYGQIKIDYTNYRAHRIAYYLVYGIDPGNQYVCHTCDNPKCCNPKHLFLGEPLDNSTDMVTKGRSSRQKGEKHGKAKLTEIQVRLIRKSNETPTRLAPRFGVSPSLISQIRHHRIWKHIN